LDSIAVVIYMGPEPSSIPVQDIECEELVPSNFGSNAEIWNAITCLRGFFGSQPAETILNGNRKFIKALLVVIINMDLHQVPDITEYFSQSWVNKMPFFSCMFPKDKVLEPTFCTS
jgi:hypothetical protein